MKFYYDKKDGTTKELTQDELSIHLSANQIQEAICSKIADPLEEVSYMAINGFIRVEL